MFTGSAVSEISVGAGCNPGRLKGRHSKYLSRMPFARRGVIRRVGSKIHCQLSATLQTVSGSGKSHANVNRGEDENEDGEIAA